MNQLTSSAVHSLHSHSNLPPEIRRVLDSRTDLDHTLRLCYRIAALLKSEGHWNCDRRNRNTKRVLAIQE